MKGEKIKLIKVANMDIFYWSVRSSIRRVGDGVNGVDEIVILVSHKFNFIRVYDNLV